VSLWKKCNTNRKATSSAQKKFKSWPSVDKAMVIIFWNTSILNCLNGHHWIHPCSLPAKQNYSACQLLPFLLKEHVKESIWQKRPSEWFFSKTILNYIQLNFLRKWAWKVLQYFCYSPDLSTSNFHVYGPLKVSSSEVRTKRAGPATCLSFPADGSKPLYTARFMKLVQWWKNWKVFI
jgi:hypothetical protein